ncbi:hypothetical protein H0H93_007682 [Arthromyces matolae]|nr:hypothetical protein H0H93_007682 [Arthromyces matolae]
MRTHLLLHCHFEQAQYKEMRLTLVTVIPIAFTYLSSVSLPTYAVAIPAASSNVLLNHDSLQLRALSNFPVLRSDKEGNSTPHKPPGNNKESLQQQRRDKLFAEWDDRRKRSNEHSAYDQQIQTLLSELDFDDQVKKLPDVQWAEKTRELVNLLPLDFATLTVKERGLPAHQDYIHSVIELLDGLINPAGGNVRDKEVVSRAKEVKGWFEQQLVPVKKD